MVGLVAGGPLMWVWFWLGCWGWGCVWWLGCTVGGLGEFTASPGAPGEGSGAVLVLASLCVRRWWCSSVRIGVPQWDHFARERLSLGVVRCGLFL